MSGAKRKPAATRTSVDWSKLSGLHFEDAIAAALTGPVEESAPCAKTEKASQTALSLKVRLKLDLSRAEFAQRYQIPRSKLRDWDQGRAQPDDVAVAFLKTIDALPDEVANILLETPNYRQ